ncbi:hypothetical protein JCM6882_001004 [Rhodosporidiobolus microsporus]
MNPLLPAGGQAPPGLSPDYQPQGYNGQHAHAHSAPHIVPLNRRADSLGRGRACRQCRKRKIKCNGRQPICTPCETAALRVGQDLSTVNCDFDTEEERKKPVGGGKVSALELKISQLEERIQELTNGKGEGTASPPSPSNNYSPRPSSASLPPAFVPPPPQPQAHPLPPEVGAYHPMPYSPSAGYPPVHPYAFPPQPGQPFPPPPAPYPAPPNAHPPYPYYTSPVQPTNGHPYPLQPPMHAAPPPPPSSAPAPSPSSSFPSVETTRLPSWPTLRRLVNTFFDYPHEAVDLINRKRFMARFERPADDPEFPSECLLHAMVATASDLIGEEAAFEGEERYWPEGMNPSLWHADQADRLIPLCFRKEQKLLQVAQAAVLFAATNVAHGRFARSFLETSTAVRICVALGLNHVGSSEVNLPLSSLMSGRTSLEPPKDDEDTQERAVTFWFAYTVEVISAAATGWACCIDERDITTFLPAAAPYHGDPAVRESLYLHSPSFFTTNPPDLVRLVQINLKSVVLMNRVITFVHRTTALASTAAEKPLLSQVDHAKIRASPAFQKLEAAIDVFQRRAPNQLIALLEPQAFLLPALTSTSVILLHESLTTGEEGCPSLAKCNEAANVMLQNMHVLNNASFHPRHIPPFLSFCYLVCGRTFIREIALKQARGNASADEIDRLKESVETVIERLKASRTPLGPKCAATLATLLSKPDIALPVAGVGQSSSSSGAPAPMAQLLDLMEAGGGTEADLCA